MHRKTQIITKGRAATFIGCLLVIGFTWHTYRAPAQLEKRASSMMQGIIPEEGIPSISNPTFESVIIADQYLNNNGYGIAAHVQNVWRFYPFQILVWHQVVNDVVQGIPILISYDPLALRASVFDRRVSSNSLTFDVSPTMQESQLLLQDRESSSLWEMTSHKAVQGEKTGTVLTQLPSEIMTWDAFKQLHPSGSVLSKKTGFDRDYTHDPYGSYQYTADMNYPIGCTDTRLTEKNIIIGIEWNGKQNAIPETALKQAKSTTMSVGDTNVRLVYDTETDIVRAYQGATVIPHTRSYWFSWACAFPQTDLQTSL